MTPDQKTALRDLIALVEAEKADVWKVKEAAGKVWGQGSGLVYRVGQAYKGSFDAAARLHKEMLPECIYVAGPQAVSIWHRDNYGDLFCAPIKGEPGNPARAWLLAILKAVEAQK